MENDLSKFFKEYVGGEPAPLFDNYLKERIPDAEREPTLKVIERALIRLKVTGFLPPKNTLSSLIFDLINYSYGEWWFAVRDIADPKQKAKMAKDMDYVDSIAQKVALKFTILVRGVRAGKLKISSMSPYSPVNTTLKALLVELINLNSNFSLNDPQKTLINDLFDKIFRKAHGTLKMLSMGLGNDAYASWRTLHEAECTLYLLVNGGKSLCDVYVKHIVFNNAFRGSINDKTQTDAIFEEIKKEMKANDLKSKDMKKFIEYGWLYSSPEYQSLVVESNLFNKYATPIAKTAGQETIYKILKGPEVTNPDYKIYDIYSGILAGWTHDKMKDFRLNFRDGIESLAGLTRYSDWYEAASEVSHSSAVFFYPNDQFFFDLSTVALYQLVLRVATLYRYYMKKVFEKNPLTSQMADSLMGMSQTMALDQAKRFEKLYGISVIENDKQERIVNGILKEGKEPKEEDGTKPGPILREEETQ